MFEVRATDKSTKARAGELRSAHGAIETPAFMSAMPQAQFKVEGADRVGALVGGELARSSLIALGLGILGILIFVTLRFELAFAVGAIVALLHDVLITVGMFSLLHRELTLTMIVTSNVPPPRSNTKTVWSSFNLSRP